MIKRFFTNLRIDDAHPAEEKLLAYVDDELSARQAARVRAHLGTCWSCRSRLDKIEETISLFVEFRRQIQSPLTSRPPGEWNGFGGNLAIAAAAPIENAGWSWAEIFRRWRSYFSTINPSNWSSTAIRAFSGSVAAILIAALLWQLLAVRTVSAVELLDKATAAESERLVSISQPVVYRKLRVQKQRGEGLEWEIWRDAVGGRYRQTLSSDNRQSLDGILSRNRMNALEPLSTASFRAWHDPLREKMDGVSRSRNERGETLLDLHTENGSAENIGEISKAILKVREADWHPIELDLHVKGTESDETYTFKEIAFEVISLSTLQPKFFGEDAAPQIVYSGSPNPSPAAALNPSPEPDAAIANSSVIPPTVVATDEDEVEVLRLLSQAKADLGEQITVKRENGLLRVRGIVETQQRKAEILAALQPQANNAAVMISIETYAEATARQAKEKSNSAVTQETVSTDTTQAAAENELADRLGTTAAARIYSRQMVEGSYRAMNHIYALKRLSKQFTAEQLRQMKPEARAKWVALIASHAGRFRAETESLRGQLQRVFGSQGGGAADVPNVDDWSDVQRGVERLVDLGAANDQVIRSAFAVSSDGPSFSAIKTAQFWQSLRAAESLATSLQRIR